jgi:hypothetical protein
MHVKLITKLILALKDEKNRKILLYTIMGIAASLILVPILMLYSIKALFGQKIGKDFNIATTDIYKHIEPIHEEWLNGKKSEMEKMAKDKEDEYKYWVEDGDEDGGGHYEYPVTASVELNQVSLAYVLAFFSTVNEDVEVIKTKTIKLPEKQSVITFLDQVSTIESSWIGESKVVYKNNVKSIDQICELYFKDNKAKTSLYKASVGNFEKFISKIPSDTVATGGSGGIQIGIVGINAENYKVPENGGSNKIVYFQQSGGQVWSNVKFGGGNIASSGCSITSFSMVASYLTGTNVYPSDIVATIAAKNNGNYNRFYDGDKGQSWSIFPAIAGYYGVRCNAIGSDSIMQSLQAGNPVIMSCVPGEFTSKGHFIVLTGLTADGYIVVNDPSHPDKSYKKYTLAFIKGQGKGWWSFSK